MAKVQNADGYEATAMRPSPAEEAAWDVPNGSAVEILDAWAECEYGEHHGFVKARNLPGLAALAPGALAEVRDSFKGNTQTCMRKRAEQDSSAGNVLCYVANGPGAVKLVEYWVQVRWEEKRGFVKARHVELLPEGAGEPPAKKAKTAAPASEGLVVTEEVLGPPCNLVLEDQPDWQFELGKDQWKSYRPEECVELDRYFKYYDSVKEKGETEPRIAKLRLMKKDAVVDLAAHTCTVAGGNPRQLRRRVVDPGWLSNSYFCEAFKAAMESAGMAMGGPAEEAFDFRFNQDFRELKDDGRELLRGGQRYELPVGWKRFSVKVQGQYDDGDNDWLKDDESGWAVAYHGTSGDSLPGILSTGFKVGPGQKFAKETGAGIYCTPFIKVAQYYSKPKLLEGHSVQVVLQLRVKPSAIKKVTDAPTDFEKQYWVINKPEDMRAYGVLVRELSLRDFIPVHYVVFGPSNSTTKAMMATLKKEADQQEKDCKAKAKAKGKAKAKAK